MLLSQLIIQAGITLVKPPNEIAPVTVNHLDTDSRKVKQHGLFCAVHGFLDNANQYIASAIAQGAVAILIDSRYANEAHDVPCYAVENLHLKLGAMLNVLHGTRAAQAKIVGITGTDGKTSISHMLAQMNPERCAIIGTLGAGTLNNLTYTGYTTPDVVTTHKWVKQLSESGVAEIVMEASSHALDQARIGGLKIDTAVLSNFGRDHLDYHPDLAHYKASKAKLFSRAEVQHLVLNTDDDFGKELLALHQHDKHIIAYGFEAPPSSTAISYLSADNISLTPQGISADILYHHNGTLQRSHAQFKLMARFNLYNLLAVASVHLAHGHDFEATIMQLQSLRAIPGRMQRIDHQDRLFVIDYAHTPQALEQALKALREHHHQKVICVFGCGGDRDTGKRAMMAKVAEQHADSVIVTDDNPRTESPQAIFEAISSGFKNADSVHFIHDRQTSINFANDLAGANDAVLIAGKGHEDYQIYGTERKPFSDLDAVAHAIAGSAA